ncbi:ABC transporter ATP-binding protein YtrB [Planctomycetes bacterium Poly30]|uniref:ABC transporter ATP-binding protein YtrB n=2 Tax=Saltatorellus ferox TaxID=2528018 RepID=A0A518EPA0_9BACT|nr:ABC transporter ATP-binding protein YtrB [Planctomycetes bacterium Poly30]
MTMATEAPARAEVGAETAVKIRGLRFGWTRKDVLKGVDLDVQVGEIMALVGANGAGKSTLLSLLCGAEPYRPFWRRPKGVIVDVLGLDPVRNGHELRSKIGYVPDRTELPKWMKIRDHFRLVKALHPRWEDREAARFLERFGLNESMRYADLSKGQRMLENVTAALAVRPPLLLLDEPFSGLDPVARRLVTDGLIEHMCENRASVLLVSHSIADVERCADRVALFAGGRVAEVASVDELRGRSEHGDLEDALVAVALDGRAA